VDVRRWMWRGGCGEVDVDVERWMWRGGCGEVDVERWMRYEGWVVNMW
jgi:hypothetical protein